MPRNASGTYSLPSGNPVVSGTLIEANWANTTLSDLASAMTNSLSRTGEGGMLAPLRFADGTVSVPGFAWTNETSTGLYRFGSGDMRVTVQGVDTGIWTSTGLTIPSTKTLAALGNATVGGTLVVTGAVTLNSTLAVTGAITATGGVNGNVTGNLTGNVTGNVTGNASTATAAQASSFAVTASSGEAILAANRTGQSTAYLYSSDTAWGLYSAAGGHCVRYDRAAGSFTHYGNLTGNAGTVTNGVYTTGDQFIAGNKTFTTRARTSTSRSSASWGAAAVEIYTESGASIDFSSIAFHVQDAFNAPQFGYRAGNGFNDLGWFNTDGNRIFTVSASGLSNGILAIEDGNVYSRMWTWVKFNGTGSAGANQTINADYNVSSVYKNGTGDYTVNFRTAFVDNNYVVNVTRGRGDANGKATVIDTGINNGSVRVATGVASVGPGWEDAAVVYVTVFR